MPPPTPQLITPEFMIDAMDNHTLDTIRLHRRGLALMLRAAGKADKLDNIAETRRCAAAVLNYKPYYPPKHAFFASPAAPLPKPVEPEAIDADEPQAPDVPTATSPSLREGAGGRVSTASDHPEPVATSTPLTLSASSPPVGRAAVARAWGTASEASQPLENPAESSPPPGRTSPPSDHTPTPVSETPPQVPPPPAVPYEPTGELWPPGLDKEAWLRKYMYREPYKPYIHRNYLLALLMIFSLLFNSSPSFAANLSAALTPSLPPPCTSVYTCVGVSLSPVTNLSHAQLSFSKPRTNPPAAWSNGRSWDAIMDDGPELTKAGEDEAALVRAAGRGDGRALERLAARYELALLGLARALVGGREDVACDAVQDAWVRVMKSGRHFQGSSSVKTWLYRIVINRCADLRKKMLAQSNGHAAAIETAAGAPTREADHPRHDGEALQRAMASLDGERRLILILCYHAGMTHPQAADILDLPLGTLKSRLHAALEDLRTRLAPGSGGSRT
ncbi:MAG: sigma-70 family RNA polymerase sigma factor [Phycisphaerales bacterium]